MSRGLIIRPPTAVSTPLKMTAKAHARLQAQEPANRETILSIQSTEMGMCHNRGMRYGSNRGDPYVWQVVLCKVVIRTYGW